MVNVDIKRVTVSECCSSDRCPSFWPRSRRNLDKTSFVDKLCLPLLRSAILADWQIDSLRKKQRKLGENSSENKAEMHAETSEQMFFVTWCKTACYASSTEEFYF